MKPKQITTSLGLALLMVAALLCGGTSNTLYAQQSPASQIIPGTEEQITGGQYIDIAGRVDAAANSFVAIASHEPANNNITWIEIRRFSPAGALTWYDEARPREPNFKIENINLTHSGPTLFVQMTVHSYGPGPRIRRAEQVPFEGVFTYRPGMENEEGAPGAFQPSEQTVEIDYAQIQRMIDAEGVEIRAALVPAVKSEMERQGVLTLNNVYASHGLYNRISETAFQSSVNALTSYRACKAP
jgi:hypothetical protein